MVTRQVQQYSLLSRLHLTLEVQIQKQKKKKSKKGDGTRNSSRNPLSLEKVTPAKPKSKSKSKKRKAAREASWHKAEPLASEGVCDHVSKVVHHVSCVSSRSYRRGICCWLLHLRSFRRCWYRCSCSCNGCQLHVCMCPISLLYEFDVPEVLEVLEVQLVLRRVCICHQS